ncbi:MAG: WD40 repeat domain-containing protein [Gomphosphaeria aponina SAG 52.96 = DSM 107014]|uniref:WD40 repeat domain-containing protein n=1 Tax=Gomphosphaeria aponina SAG 52.96 = DSM 107014 TaxID=1521640 RepID=A0A941GP38_9CHRO|nr:WD40 repeat domain-containing protein [Gomphosphaeria aponina SAG 52.96 = DSM 107014]
MFGLKNQENQLFHQQWTGQLTEYITAINWSIQGDLAASSAAGEVMLWQSQSESSVLLLKPYDTQDQSINCLGFSADGQFLAAGGQDGKIRIWQIQPELDLIHTLDFGSQWIEHLCWHTNKQELAFSLGRYVQVWDAVAGEIIITLPFASSSVLGLTWQPLGERLAMAGNGGIKVWDRKNWDEDPLILEMPGACTQVAWSFDGEYIAGSCLDQTVWLWRWGNNEPWRMTGFGGKVRNLTWSKPKSGVAPLLAVSSYENIIVWKKAEKDEQGWFSRALSLHNDKICDLQFHPQSLLLASVAEDGMLLLWQKAKQLTQRLTGASSGFSVVAWHPSGNQLAAGGQASEVLVWTKSQRGQGFG